MEAHQLINQDSGDTEYYTDPRIIEAAREVMGEIDLDPASSQDANCHVMARRYFTKEIDGLAQRWSGRVWLNHPFSKGWKACDDACKRKTCADRGHHVYEDLPSNADWIRKLIFSHEGGPVEQAICITFGATSEQWFQPLLRYPQCFAAPRTNYYLPDGTLKKGVTKGSVITYLGPYAKRFAKQFSQFGHVK